LSLSNTALEILKACLSKRGGKGVADSPLETLEPGRELIHRLSTVLSRAKVIHRLLTVDDIYLLTQHRGEDD